MSKESTNTEAAPKKSMKLHRKPGRRLIDVILEISTEFVGLHADDIDHAISKALQTIGEFMSADRCHIGQFSADKKYASSTHEWCAPGVESVAQLFQNSRILDSSWYMQELLSGKIVNIPRVELLPLELQKARRTLEAAGIKSGVSIPLRNDESVFGFIGFTSVKKNSDWSDDDISCLKVLGQIVSNALQRKQAEDKLRDSEGRYRDLYENLPVAVVRAAGDGTIQSANPAAAALMGFDAPEEMIGSSVNNLCADPEHRAELLNQLERDRSVSGCEGYFQRPDGSPIWISMNVRAELDDQQKIVFMDVIAEDITERKQAELKLQEAEAELKHTIEVVPGIIAKAHAQTGYFTDCNPALTNILGFSPEEFMARPFIEFVHPDDRQKTISEVEKQLKGSPVAQFENRYICKDGSYKWLEWRATAANDKGIVYIAAIEITTRKQAEEALKRSEAEFRTIVETAPSMLIINDANGRNLYVSPNCEKMTGYSLDELLNNFIWWVHDDDSEDCRKLLERSFSEGIGYRDFEYKAVRKNGDVWYASSSWEPLRGDRGELAGGILQTMDITERRRTEELLREGEEKHRVELMKADRLISVGRLAAGVAHEINNPMAVLYGMVQELNELPESCTKEMAEQMLKVSRRIHVVVNKLLTFSRQSEVIRTNYDVNRIVGDTLSLITSQLTKSGIEIIEKLDPDIPFATVNPHQIQQVLLDLILNAMDAMPEGGQLKIESECVDDSVRIVVEDNGHGIDPDNLGKIFLPFFTTKDVGKGTGLGLSNSYGIVEDHNGSITVTSQVGAGSRFEVTIPATRRL